MINFPLLFCFSLVVGVLTYFFPNFPAQRWGLTTLLFSLSDIFFSFFLFFCYFPSLLIFFSDISFSLLFSFLFIFLLLFSYFLLFSLCYFPSFWYFSSPSSLLLFFSYFPSYSSSLLFSFPFFTVIFPAVVWGLATLSAVLPRLQGQNVERDFLIFFSLSVSHPLTQMFFFSLINCSVLFPLAFTFLTVNNRLGGSSVYLFQFLSVFRQLPRF